MLCNNNRLGEIMTDMGYKEPESWNKIDNDKPIILID